MATANIDSRPVPAVELSNIPLINLPSASRNSSPSTSFQPNPGCDPSSHGGSNAPATDSVAGTNKPHKPEDDYLKRPQFVARDGAIGGRSHNETSVE